MNTKRPTPRPIIIKMPKVKDRDRILKAAREKQLIIYKGAPIRLSVDFLTETLQVRRECQEILKVRKSKNLQTRLSSKAVIENQRTYKEPPRPEKAKGVNYHQTSIT